MNMVMAGDGHGHLYHIDSLEFPRGYLEDVKRANQEIELGSIDVVMTNPPFGSDIPITDPNILQQFDLAHIWERRDEGNFDRTGRLHGSVSPEILFIERCVQWLKPGGRMGIVLPDGILGNPAAEYIRWWILRHTWVLASVDLPVEVFIVEANVNILTSVLFLKKKSHEEILAEDIGGRKEYPVFRAVAEKVGFDRRVATRCINVPRTAKKLSRFKRRSSVFGSMVRSWNVLSGVHKKSSMTICKSSPRNTRRFARNIRSRGHEVRPADSS
jgi:type I restriction enzyme M protein